MVFCVLRADNVPNPKGTFRVWGILFCFNQRFLGDWAHVNPQNCCPQNTMATGSFPKNTRLFCPFAPFRGAPGFSFHLLCFKFFGRRQAPTWRSSRNWIRSGAGFPMTFWGGASSCFCVCWVSRLLNFTSFFGEVSTVFPEFCFSFPEGFLLWWFGSYHLRIVLQHTGRIKRRLVSCLTCFAALPIEVLLVVIGLQQFGLDAHEQSCGVDNIEHTAR